MLNKTINFRITLLFLLLFFCATTKAQVPENEPPPGFDIGEQLKDVPIDPYEPPKDPWDNIALYWETEPNKKIEEEGDFHVPEYIQKIEKKGPKNEIEDGLEREAGDRQTKSQVLLTKPVKPGETHTQSVKVLRDPNNSTEKKVIDLIVNGVVVGTVTFSTPLRDSNGIDIYSKMTVEVFRHCPIAITTITFDNPQTSIYEGSQHSTDGNRDKALTDFSLYQNLGIMNFTAPINEEEDIIFTGSLTVANSQDDKKDPCVVAKELTDLAANPVFKKAVQDTRDTPDFYKKEYSTSLGKNTSGQIYAGEMNPGEVDMATVKHYSVQSFFADIHNHPSHRIHSGIDLNAMAILNKLYPNYSGGFVLPNKEEVYAAVITDLAAAQAFVAKYLRDPKTKKAIHYPKFMYAEMFIVWSKMNSYSIESESKAQAFVINKYNAGVTFFRQNNDGKFYPLTIKETKQANGSLKYTLIPCI